MTPTDDEVTATADWILDRARVFAMIGASPRPDRPSHGVMQTLLDHGYEVIPITPRADEILGRRTWPDLSTVPVDVQIDVVDIFRRSEFAGVHVDEAITRGVGAVWLQIGVIDEEAARRARAAGLDVVMDRCPRVELARRTGN